MTHLQNYVHEFTAGSERLGERDMRAVMRRAGLTEIEQRIVLAEVRAAREFDEHSPQGVLA